MAKQITLAELLKQHKIHDAKAARRKLRASFGSTHAKNTAWVFQVPSKTYTQACKALGITTEKKARKTKTKKASAEVPATT